MKKNFVINNLLIVIFMSMIGSDVFAGIITVENADGIQINYFENGQELVVAENMRFPYSGAVVIPEEVTYNNKTYIVTGIGTYAFRQCYNLTSVSIPNSVKTIGEEAFYQCWSLTKVKMSNNLTSIQNAAFHSCYSLKSITIPKSVTYIGKNAFSGCANITSVNITDIEAWCKIRFGETDNGSSLTYNEFDNAIANPLYYAHHLFLNGEEIKDLVIPNTVTDIGEFAFYGCSGLISVVIPNSVININSYAFSGCSGLTSVVIPNSVTNINSYAFHGCSGLISIEIPNSITRITKSSFRECSGLTSVTIPSSVKRIDQYAFEGCTNLTSVHITDLASWCNILFGSNPLVYANHLYMGGTEIVDLIIPDNVTSIGSNTFSNCTGLSSLTLSNSVTSIGKSAFAFCSGLTSVTIPNSVTTIGESAFEDCDGLTSVTIPNSISKIGDRSFYHCEGLISITIDDGVKSIGSNAFAWCYGLTSITIPNSVTWIGESAFRGCKNITSITIGNSVGYIGPYGFAVFSDCLSDVFCYNKTVPETVSMAFTYHENATLHVPISSLDAYKATDPWNSFKEIVALSVNTYTLKYIVDEEIYKVINLEEGVEIIPETDPTKEGYTFSGWSEIPETMPDHDVTVTGTFSINKYKLTYNVDGKEYKSYEVEYGATITLEPAPTKEGYSFSGWSEIPETMPARDVTVTGTFTINKYKLSYIVDDEEYKSYDIDYNSTISPEEEPTKEGYTFSGWSEIPETMPANDVTITGTFTINKYKLIYMVDGEEYKSYDIEYNSAITPEAEPTKEGYTFSGWSEIPETMPASDVTVTGSFERVYSGGDVANLIDILLIGNIGDDDIALYDMNGDGELNIGDLILIIRAVNDRNNRSIANGAIMESQTVGFNADNITMKPGEITALNISLSNSTNSIYGLQFEVSLPEGFSLEKDSHDKVYEMSTNQPDDITCSNLDLGNGVYRFFIYSSTLQELRGGSLISLNLKADDNMTLDYYTVNIDNIIMSDYDGNVTKENGIFAGVKVTDFFTLLYKIDGEDYKSYEIEYGEAITPEAEPTKEGYIFSGWSEIPETMPAEDVTVTGMFTINKYKVTYIIDGEEYKTEEVEYGSTITPPNPDNREGYDFAWGDYPSTMPAEDITIYGTYTATGIVAILATEPDVKIYTVSGKPINKLQKGVNILRYRDGRTRKIIIK